MRQLGPGRVRFLENISNMNIIMTQVGSLEKFGESGRRVELLETAARLLGDHHLLLHIIKYDILWR